ncbi:MAG: 5'/3'-nucleotidase SurE, partial [Elusimicrobia bacterium CG_4_10_14_3_um_filter_49_12_50_7]
RSIFYSGTVAAAMEAAIEGLPALAISKDHEGGSFEEAANFAADIVVAAL